MADSHNSKSQSFKHGPTTPPQHPAPHCSNSPKRPPKIEMASAIVTPPQPQLSEEESNEDEDEPSLSVLPPAQNLPPTIAQDFTNITDADREGKRQHCKIKQDPPDESQTGSQSEADDGIIDIPQVYSSNLDTPEEKQKVVRLINSDSTITPKEKDRRRQAVFTHEIRKRRRIVKQLRVKEINEKSDEPSYSSIIDKQTNKPLLGCEHYPRNCRMRAECCGAWVVCRFCHDNHASMNHTMDRFKTKKVKCMLCNHIQNVQETCEKCNIKFAKHFCGKCKFYDNTPDKSIYHCDQCKLCRVGKGLGKDNFHCKNCDACVSLKYINDHYCLKKSLDANCPICGLYIKTSTKPVVFMKCGHTMHAHCFDAYTLTSYTCPLCHKALTDMSDYYKRIDEAVANQTLPEDAKDKLARILCYDCDKKTETQFHYCYLKCTVCGGYNTTLIQSYAKDKKLGQNVTASDISPSPGPQSRPASQPKSSKQPRPQSQPLLGSHSSLQLQSQQTLGNDQRRYQDAQEQLGSEDSIGITPIHKGDASLDSKLDITEHDTVKKSSTGPSFLHSGSPSTPSSMEIRPDCNKDGSALFSGSTSGGAISSASAGLNDKLIAPEEFSERAHNAVHTFTPAFSGCSDSDKDEESG